MSLSPNVLLLLLCLFLTNAQQHGQQRASPLRSSSGSHSRRGLQQEGMTTTKKQKNELTQDEHAYLLQLVEKLQPRNLPTFYDPTFNKTMIQKHAFLHLHHMKTGGTSMDGLLSCAMNRVRSLGVAAIHPGDDSTVTDSSGSDSSTTDNELVIQYMNIHECGLSHYRSCRDGEDIRCRASINASAILSYCAPLMDLDAFGWSKIGDSRKEGDLVDVVESKNENVVDGANTTSSTNSATTTVPIAKTQAVTVFRHPVNRVWSMYRFQTKKCYVCAPLKDVFAQIEDGTDKLDEMCKAQLLNHQTRNLVKIWDPEQEDQMLQGAIENMKHYFTMIGLTERMNETAQMVGKVFPWMNETFIPDIDGTTVGSPQAISCPMPHRNASPQNNRCGPDGTSHLPLPDYPDEETKAAILRHNTMDVALYEAAVQQFEYQRMALDMDDVQDE